MKMLLSLIVGIVSCSCYSFGTWDEARLSTLLRNSIQRMEQVDHLRVYSAREYEREKASIQYNRLNAIPTNQLNDIPWILTR